MPPTASPSLPTTRHALAERYRRNRARTRALFDCLADDAYRAQPIDVRHPIVFYDGHLPAFSFNTLVRKALGRPSIDRRLEDLFARGIDPDQPSRSSSHEVLHHWPDRTTVNAFTAEADRQVLEAIAEADIDRPGHPLLDRAQAVFAILEHEEMHQETLHYMWHRLPREMKREPDGSSPQTEGQSVACEWIEIPEGQATLGIDERTIEFAWDNESPAQSAWVSRFEIERHDVTNERFLAFVGAGGYRDPQWWSAGDWQWIQREHVQHPSFWNQQDGAWYWRGMFRDVALPLSWPVYVTLAEASAFARWRGVRLPTEPEFQRAAYGSEHGERPHPWGADPPQARHGAFDFSSWDPRPAGSSPDGASAWGVHDLVGNGWEWTTTPFAPFPGFRPMASYPEYSADFFDGDHFVLKGASPATASTLLRPTFRNWFRPRYPYVYATFRTVRSR